jgi:nucleotide-binding universal stress UspA family protein
MTIFKHILIPVDFSACSTVAVRIGSEMAARFQSSVTLLHVHELLPYGLPSEYEVYTPELRQRVMAEIDKSLQATKRRAESAGAPEADTKMVEGYPSVDIAEVAAKGGYDLIVMGTHGRRGIKHALLGSVAERVVRTAPCPVLTIRLPEEAVSETPKLGPLVSGAS